jgi:hypothetical protein
MGHGSLAMVFAVLAEGQPSLVADCGTNHEFQ